MQSVVLATSIAPFNIELQQAALASWRDHGFEILSVNSEAEVGILRPHFPWVEFAVTRRSAQALAGKPLVYFDDLLASLHDKAVSVCGIVNSDIHLRADSGYRSFVAREAVGSMVFGRRLEVSSLEGAGEASKYYWGFDVFFFDSRLISLFPPSVFCIGAPWWDYWAPLVVSLKSYPLKHLISPTALHVTHEAKWSEELVARFGQHLLSDVGFELAAPEESGKRFPALASVVIMMQVLASATPIVYPSSASEAAQSSLANFPASKVLREALDRLERNSALGREAIVECQQMRASLSWRLTAPVRTFKRAIEAIRRALSGPPSM